MFQEEENSKGRKKIQFTFLNNNNNNKQEENDGCWQWVKTKESEVWGLVAASIAKSL